MADDFSVRIGIDIDESKLRTLDNMIADLPNKKTVSVKVNTDQGQQEIKELYNYAKKVFTGTDFTPDFADPSKIAKQISQIRNALKNVFKSLDNGVDPNSLLSGVTKSFSKVQRQLSQGVKTVSTQIGNIRFAEDAFNIDTSAFNRMSGGLTTINGLMDNFNNAMRENGIVMQTMSDGSVVLSQNLNDVATKVVTFNSAGERTKDVFKDINSAFDVVTLGAENFDKVLNKTGVRTSLYNSIIDSLDKAGVAFDGSEKDIDQYIKRVVARFDEMGNLISASIKAAYKGVTLDTNFYTKDIEGQSALVSGGSRITDNSETTSIQKLTAEYKKLLALKKEYNTASNKGFTQTANVLSQQISQHETLIQTLRSEIKNQEELTRITQEYNNVLDKTEANSSDKFASEQDKSKIAEIKQTLSTLSTYQEKINSLRNSGNFSDNQIKEYNAEINRMISTLSDLGITYDSVSNKFQMNDFNANNIVTTQDAIQKLIQLLEEFRIKSSQTESKQYDYVDEQKIKTAINLLEQVRQKQLELTQTKLKGGTSEYITKLEQDLKQLKQELENAERAQIGFNETVRDSANYQTAYENSIKQTDDALAKMQNSAEMANKSTSNLNKGFDGLIANGVKMAASFYIFDKLQDVIYQSVQAVQDLDKTMTGLQMVTEQSDAQITTMMHNYADMARELGVTLETVAEGSEEWLRQGFSTEQTEELLRASTMLATVGGMGAAEATEALTATLNGFNMEADQAMTVVDTLNSLDSKRVQLKSL